MTLKTYISAMTGIACGAVLYSLDVQLAPLWGLLSFILNFIPNVGSIVATMLPVPVAMLDDDLSQYQKIGAFLFPGMIQTYVGNFLEPKIFGKSLNMTPMSILLALVFFGLLWGADTLGLSRTRSLCDGDFTLLRSIYCVQSSLTSRRPFAGLPGAILSVPFLGIAKVLLGASNHRLSRGLLSVIRSVTCRLLPRRKTSRTSNRLCGLLLRGFLHSRHKAPSCAAQGEQ